MKYLLIHCVQGAVAEHDDLDPRLEAELTSWIEDLTRRGVHLDGGRLQPVRDATTVRVRGGEVLIADGPFAETKEQVAGYDVIDCASLDEAAEIAARHPTAMLGVIEVRPFLG